MRTVKQTGAVVSGPIPLPTEKSIVTVNRSPHVDKKSREQFEARVHKRLIDIEETNAQTLEALEFEQAVAREALRLAFAQHKAFATTLKGVQQQRTVGDTFQQQTGGRTIVDNMQLDLLVASGGVLSHAPRMQQTALMLIDAFAPEGFTTLAKDSIFMMPHLGVLAFNLAVLVIGARLAFTGEIEVGTLVAFLFALHPLHVESVAWVSELKNTLSLPLFLLSLASYIRFDDMVESAAGQVEVAEGRDEPRALVQYVASLVLFLLAMFAKTSVVEIGRAHV